MEWEHSMLTGDQHHLPILGWKPSKEMQRKRTNSEMAKTPTRRPMDYQDDHGEGWVGLRKQSMIEKMKGYTQNDQS